MLASSILVTNYEILIEIWSGRKLDITLFASIFNSWIFWMFNCFVSTKSFFTIRFVITLITFIFDWSFMHPNSMLLQILFLWKSFATVLTDVGLFNNFLTRSLFWLKRQVHEYSMYHAKWMFFVPFLIDFRDAFSYVFWVDLNFGKRNYNQLHRKWKAFCHELLSYVSTRAAWFWNTVHNDGIYMAFQMWLLLS